MGNIRSRAQRKEPMAPVHQHITVKKEEEKEEGKDEKKEKKEKKKVVSNQDVLDACGRFVSQEVINNTP